MSRLSSLTRAAIPLIALGSLLAAGAWMGSSVDTAAAFAQDKPAPPTALQKFMRAKLGASNQVLEGLVTENFALIEMGAKKLEELSSAEQWRISNDAMFRQHSGEFRQKVGQLRTAAIDKNTDAAALAYVQTTLSCVECHKWVRAVLISDALPAQPGTTRPVVSKQEQQ